MIHISHLPILKIVLKVYGLEEHMRLQFLWDYRKQKLDKLVWVEASPLEDYQYYDATMHAILESLLDYRDCDRQHTPPIDRVHTFPHCPQNSDS